MKTLVLAAAFVLSAIPASFAQYVYGPTYYAPAPGYYVAPGYGYYGSPPAWFENNTNRGGPGPRVGAGGGMGIGAQR
jgi:hypothetical protein